MPKFIMEGKNEPDFQALDDFTQAYIEAMFWTSEAPGVTTEEWQATEDHNEGSIPGDVGFCDLAPVAYAAIVADCEEFQAKAAALLALAYEGDYNEAQAGHDFWLTRNHHGAGFWDRTALKLEGADGVTLDDALTNLAHKFGESDCSLGDDDKVYLG